jgi:hypothetical protein
MSSRVVFLEGPGRSGTTSMAAFLYRREGDPHDEVTLHSYRAERPFLGHQVEWSGGGLHGRLPAWTTIEQACAGAFPGMTITGVASKLPGEFHPRIWRPGAKTPETHERESLSGVQALRLLQDQLNRIVGTIEPVPANAQAYGHANRQLLMLAAAEVESAWKAVLRANGNAAARLTTNDYVRLHAAMRLDAYQVRLIDHPDWPIMRPFQGWSPSQPTQSLPWYSAYNDTKHDREGRLHLATLESVIHAMAGAVVMLVAQFGRKSMGAPMDGWNFPGLAVTSDPMSDLDFFYLPAPDYSPMQPVPCPGLA